jgi:flagellum-specific ATP synthase
MLTNYLAALDTAELISKTGRVTQFFGLVVEANGPEVFVGERCDIYSHKNAEPVPAEVVGIRNNTVLLMPYGQLHGIRVGSEVVATGKPVEIPVGEQLLGRVVDAFGQPLDGKGAMSLTDYRPVYSTPLNPLSRPRIKRVLETGVKSIDTLLTVGRGQRVGIFAGSGVGKSTLLGMIARNMNADINVIALVGERGREVLDFIEEALGEEGLARSVIVVATSDQSALVRSHAALAATAIAEYFRDQGSDVVLMMDSITRFAMAQREVGISVGEPPTARGYTPSVFAALPRLLERGGTAESGGSITAFYTVLVEGDDINDPIADSIRAILDGAVVLTRELANQRHFPSIDVLQSNSRLAHNLVSESEQQLCKKIVQMIDVYRSAKDMIDIGAYRSGANPQLDRAIDKMPAINEFLCQSQNTRITRSMAMSELSGLIGKG